MTLLGLILHSQSSIIKVEKIEEVTSHYLVCYWIPSVERQVLTIFVLATVAETGISGRGNINPAGGLGGAVSPPVGSRGEAPGS